MSSDNNLRDGLKKVKQAVSGTSNVAAAINVGGKGRQVTASGRQRVVQRDGVTTTITETYETKTSTDDDE